MRNFREINHSDTRSENRMHQHILQRVERQIYREDDKEIREIIQSKSATEHTGETK